MKCPLVSIVMPCYNAAHFLEYALFGIAEQTLEDFELVIINDGSSDSTHEIISTCKIKNVVYINKEHNEGIASALNDGLRASKGRFVARFDSDDFMYSHRLRDQVLFLLERDDISILGSGSDVFGDLKTVHRPPEGHQDLINQILLNNPMIHPTIMVRRELIDNGDFYYRGDLRTDEDYELWSRLMPKYRFANLGWSTIRYRIHSSNNQRIPGRKEAKSIIVSNIFKQYDIDDPCLVEAVVNFQCSGFIERDSYYIMRDYALSCQKASLPRLAWLHDWLVYEKKYQLFMDYTLSPIMVDHS